MTESSFDGSYRPIKDEPTLTREQARAFTSSGEVAERRKAAMADALDPDDARDLMLDSDAVVRSLALGNHAGRREDIATALELFPEHEAQVARQENAPLRFLRDWPLRHATTSDPSQQSFLDAVDASASQRELFRQRASDLEEAGDLRRTLGEIWDEIVPPTS